MDPKALYLTTVLTPKSARYVLAPANLRLVLEWLVLQPVLRENRQ